MHIWLILSEQTCYQFRASYVTYSQLLDRAVNPYLSKIVEFSADYAVRRQVKSCSSFAEYEIVNCKEEVA